MITSYGIPTLNVGYVPVFSWSLCKVSNHCPQVWEPLISTQNIQVWSLQRYDAAIAPFYYHGLILILT